MKKKNRILLFAVLASLLSGASCKPDPSDPPATEEFDRAALLTNLADNFIVPAWEEFDTKISQKIVVEN